MANMFKKTVFTLSCVLLMCLTSCQTDTSSSQIIHTKPDLNDFTQTISDEDAEARLLKCYDTNTARDSVGIFTEVPEFLYREASTPIEEGQDVNQIIAKNNLYIKGSLTETSNFTGLKEEKNLNLIEGSFNVDNINCVIEKKGINPKEKDRVILDDATVTSYIKNNKEYANVSDPHVREFFPYILYGFSDKYPTIDDAKTEAGKIPEKFYDPDPIFSQDQLPLMETYTSFGAIKFSNVLKYLMNLNSNAQPRFMEFKTDGENFLVEAKILKNHVVQFVVKISKLIGKPLSHEQVSNFVNSELFTLNLIQFDFIFDDMGYISYTNFEVDLGVTIPNKNEQEKITSIDAYTFNIEANSWFDFKDAYVTYPSDLNSYKEYDLEMPEMENLIK